MLSLLDVDDTLSSSDSLIILRYSVGLLDKDTKFTK